MQVLRLMCQVYVHVYFCLLVCLLLQREALGGRNSRQNGNWRPGWVKVGSTTLNQLHGLPLSLSKVVVPADHLVAQIKSSRGRITWPRSEAPVCGHSSRLPPPSLPMILLPGIPASLSISTGLLSLDSDEMAPSAGSARNKGFRDVWIQDPAAQHCCASTGRMSLGF